MNVDSPQVNKSLATPYDDHRRRVPYRLLPGVW